MGATRTSILGAGVILSITAASASPSLADPSDDKLLSQQFFEQGRALAKAGKWGEACPKFEASLRHDATLGTRLNLADCYEKIGKLASAWSLLRDSADLSRAAGDAKRRDYALRQAAALQPRLPRLTITGPATQPPGLAVTRDGVALDLAALGTELYVDPGPHEVTASAPGFELFKVAITVGEAGAESVVIRELERSKAPVMEPRPAPAAATKPPESTEPAEPAKPDAKNAGAEGPDRSTGGSDPGRTRRFAGMGLVGGGAILAGVGFFLGTRASSAYDEATALCGPELICEDDADLQRGKALMDRARDRATLSTVLVIGGAAVAAAGAAVWITAPKRVRERAESAVVPVVSARDLGVAFVGRF